MNAETIAAVEVVLEAYMSEGASPHGFSADVVDTVRSLLGDLDQALDAIEEVMGEDKGPDEEEWARWANHHLPLMQRHGREEYTVDFG